MTSNRYAGACAVCGKAVGAGVGYLVRRGGAWAVLCAEHKDTEGFATSGGPRGRRDRGSNYTRFSSGAEVYTNRNGRCEDAPCCGCCS